MTGKTGMGKTEAAFCGLGVVSLVLVLWHHYGGLPVWAVFAIYVVGGLIVLGIAIAEQLWSR
jgi:hypothetical protein